MTEPAQEPFRRPRRRDTSAIVNIGHLDVLSEASLATADALDKAIDDLKGAALAMEVRARQIREVIEVLRAERDRQNMAADATEEVLDGSMRMSPRRKSAMHEAAE